MTNDDDAYLTRSLGFLLADVSRLVRQRFDQRAQALDLTRAQWRVLAQLRRREGINQRALAEILEIENITLTRHIDRLEAKGLLERRADPTDRRARTLFLMPKTRALLGKLRALSEETRAEALDGICDAEAEQMIDTLLRIKANMIKHQRPDAAPPVETGRSKSNKDMVGADE